MLTSAHVSFSRKVNGNARHCMKLSIVMEFGFVMAFGVYDMT